MPSAAKHAFISLIRLALSRHVMACTIGALSAATVLPARAEPANTTAVAGAVAVTTTEKLVATALPTLPALAAAGVQLQLLAAQPMKDADTFIAYKGLRQMRLVLQRDVESERLGVVLTRALKSNTSTSMVAMAQMGSAFSSHRSFVRGDTISFEMPAGQPVRLVIKTVGAAQLPGGDALVQELIRAWSAPPAP
jgi:hypothetical protein